MLNIMLKAASAPPTTQEMIDAAAVRLVHLWRRIDQLGKLPLNQSDRDEVRLQKTLIKGYILFLSKIKQVDGPLQSKDQEIFDDLTNFTDEANRAIDEAGITH